MRKKLHVQDSKNTFLFVFSITVLQGCQQLQNCLMDLQKLQVGDHNLYYFLTLLKSVCDILA